MDEIKQLLGRITALNDHELEELRGLILDASDALSTDPARVLGVEGAEQLESLAAAATTVRQEVRRREENILAAHEATRVLASHRAEPLRVSARVPDDRLPVFGCVSQRRAHALTASGREWHGAARQRRLQPGVLDPAAHLPGDARTHGDELLVTSLKVERGPDRTLRTTDSAFLAQYWGGPRDYSELRGHPRLRMRHAPFRMDADTRDRWLQRMHAAVDDLHLPPAHEAQLWTYLERAAVSPTRALP